MYIPRPFNVDDRIDLHDFITLHDFAPLFVAPDSMRHEIVHLPFVLERDRGEHGTLWAHVARANPVWKSFDGQTRATVVFQGPHGYISPRAYTSRDDVPTWNYAVVHASGCPMICEDPERTAWLMSRLAETHERDTNQPWTTADVSPEHYQRLSAAIVTFSLPIQRLEGKFKLSQNRTLENRRGAVDYVRDKGGEGNHALADIMEAAIPVEELECQLD